MELKHYRLNGLNYYVSAVSKEIAVVVCLKNRWGVSENDLIEVERIVLNLIEKHRNF